MGKKFHKNKYCSEYHIQYRTIWFGELPLQALYKVHPNSTVNESKFKAHNHPYSTLAKILNSETFTLNMSKKKVQKKI